MKAMNRGFTLVEAMVVVAIIAILAAIAYPAYSDHVTRGRIPQATAPLSDARVRLEQMAIDFRGYRLPGGVNPCTGGGTPPHLTWIAQFSNADFTVTCTSTANAYLVTATGVGRMAGFVYTVNQANVRASTVTGLNGWTGNASCWVVKKGGHCG